MNKNIIIVGAGQGVGLETARRFGKEGYSVGLIRRGQEQIEEMAAELSAEGIDTYFEPADAYDPKQIERAIKLLADKMSGIDVLFYNVPGPLGKAYVPATEISTELITEFLNMRVVSALKSAQAALPYVKESKGSILYTSGQSDRYPFPYTAAIGAPQAALRLLSEHLHNELKGNGVFVGYFPLHNPPLYTDLEKEKERTDLPAGFHLDERVVASDVAEKIYQLNITRDRFECAVAASKNVSEIQG
ncbi:SDR family NAD(P)-dependent oxidoreductase [Paenibacillus chitinolyticus]|uniref:SDR family NAD(P)-dependent oxidoreductase n=1 Tax=Paenibacillus chitinolyticus TaxID=79263 RepID=UPI00366FBA40